MDVKWNRVMEERKEGKVKKTATMTGNTILMSIRIDFTASHKNFRKIPVRPYSI